MSDEERETQELPARWWDAEDRYWCGHCEHQWSRRCNIRLSEAWEKCPRCGTLQRPTGTVAVEIDRGEVA